MLALAVLAAAFLAPLLVHADAAVRFYYFFDPDCLSCTEVHGEVIEPLLAQYGESVAAEERDISDAAVYGYLLQLESQFDVTSPSIPEVFIGVDALIGPDEIRTSLAERIEHYLAQGGVELPVVESAATSQPTAGAGLTIHAAYFYQPGCDACERSEHALRYIQQKYPQLQLARFNVQEEMALNQFLCLQARVPENLHLTAPALFVGREYLAEGEITSANIEALIKPYLTTGADEPWAGWEDQQSQVESTILERFRSFGLWTVVGAGLLDGVNPCAFATMIFLVSYLSVRKRKGRELLATGAAFTIGVFVAYLGVGLGLLRFLTSLPVLSTVGRWIYGFTMVLCLALAWGSFADYRKARQGRLEDMSLKLPARLRGWTHNLIREGSRARNYVLASLALGFAVSIVELACTGQVYLPTILFVLGLPEWRTRAALALLAYNVMFVVPLIVVFLLAYFGTTSKQLLEWMNRRAAAVKLGTALLFLLLAAWLAFGLAAL